MSNIEQNYTDEATKRVESKQSLSQEEMKKLEESKDERLTTINAKKAELVAQEKAALQAEASDRVSLALQLEDYDTAIDDLINMNQDFDRKFAATIGVGGNTLQNIGSQAANIATMGLAGGVRLLESTIDDKSEERKALKGASSETLQALLQKVQERQLNAKANLDAGDGSRRELRRLNRLEKRINKFISKKEENDQDDNEVLTLGLH